MLNEHVARRGLMFVLSSPSGAGKSTLARKLIEDGRQHVAVGVGHDASAQRPAKIDGREYKFMSRETFEQMADRGEFLEHAMVFGNHYGTPRAPVEAMLIQGRDVLFDVDWQGARALRAAAPRGRGRHLHPAAVDGGAGAAPARARRRQRGRDQEAHGALARRDRPLGGVRLRAGQHAAGADAGADQTDPRRGAAEAPPADVAGSCTWSG